MEQKHSHLLSIVNALVDGCRYDDAQNGGAVADKVVRLVPLVLALVRHEVVDGQGGPAGRGQDADVEEDADHGAPLVVRRLVDEEGEQDAGDERAGDDVFVDRVRIQFVAV